ncbi:hypothetical protein TNIN_80581 [Trichonephila inaurata madagascariensis]|uniref:Uncharacterized protein n=1 Tax=Trichonephila inaurata madagascariensis TaxID=2747483 RepID=A0A8X7BP05_9ARAC|nr:hypothetical protein TNIN_80581 [Trichonephila inaurata madagascariensis]
MQENGKKRSYPGPRRGGLRFRQGPHNSGTYTNLYEQRPPIDSTVQVAFFEELNPLQQLLHTNEPAVDKSRVHCKRSSKTQMTVESDFKIGREMEQKKRVGIRCTPVEFAKRGSGGIGLGTL